jgi:hypothetical protein
LCKGKDTLCHPRPAAGRDLILLPVEGAHGASNPGQLLPTRCRCSRVPRLVKRNDWLLAHKLLLLLVRSQKTAGTGGGPATLILCSCCLSQKNPMYHLLLSSAVQSTAAMVVYKPGKLRHYGMYSIMLSAVPLHFLQDPAAGHAVEQRNRLNPLTLFRANRPQLRRTLCRHAPAPLSPIWCCHS